MSVIHYQKLFEVQLLHEYYLAEKDKPEYFALNEAERKASLDKRLFNNRYDIWQDLSIEPTEACKKLLSNYSIRMVPLKTGFFAGIKVKRTNSTYVPFISQTDSLTFTFRIIHKNAYFNDITNHRLRSNIPASYYFTNTDPGNQKSYPALSAPPVPYQFDKSYELGDIVLIGSDIMQAIIKTNSDRPADWRKLNGVGLVTENDRILLPLKFYYSFNPDAIIKQASFTLRQNGTTYKTQTFTNLEKLEGVMLDFTQDDSIPPREIKDGLYELRISGDNGYLDVRTIQLCNEQGNTPIWGIINIHNQISDSAYSIFESTGEMKNPAPIFEIRLKSRIAYWRYKSDKGRQLAVTPKTAPYLEVANGNLRTKKPLPLVAAPQEFKNDDPQIPTIYLPNPAHQSLRIEPDGRLYADIYLSKIKDLIIEVA